MGNLRTLAPTNAHLDAARVENTTIHHFHLMPTLASFIPGETTGDEEHAATVIGRCGTTQLKSPTEVRSTLPPDFPIGQDLEAAVGGMVTGPPSS